MIDVHSHILPGIDDGPKDPKESILIIKGLSEIGFKTMVLTPHLDPVRLEDETEAINKRYEEFGKIASESGITAPLFLGSEIVFEPSFMKSDPKPPLAFEIKGKRYQLIELLPVIHPVAFEIYSDYVKKHGLIPIIAHAERLQRLESDNKLKSKLKEMGFLFQVNVTSFANRIKKEFHENAKNLLKENAIDIMATDCHSLEGMDKVLEGISYIRGKTHAWQRFFEL